jgi:hypothetical protein
LVPAVGVRQVAIALGAVVHTGFGATSQQTGAVGNILQRVKCSGVEPSAGERERHKACRGGSLYRRGNKSQGVGKRLNGDGGRGVDAEEAHTREAASHTRLELQPQSRLVDEKRASTSGNNEESKRQLTEVVSVVMTPSEAFW